MAEIPLLLTDMNMFINEKSYAGIVQEIILPTPVKTKIDHTAGGSNGTRRYPMVFQAMEATFKFASFEAQPFRLMGFAPGKSVGILVRGVLQHYEEIEPVSSVLRGRLGDPNMGTWSKGQNNGLTVKMDVTYFKLERSGELLCEIDIDNNVEKWGDVDLGEPIRRILLL